MGHLSFTEILDTSLKVSWQEPLERNGVIMGKQSFRLDKKGWLPCQTKLLRVAPGLLGVTDVSFWLY